MNLKYCLILLTLISVVADTMLLPFYPQFFSAAFSENSAQHVGFYIATCCFTVMTTFPLWAKLAKRVHELHIWIYSQIAAASLGFYCYFAESLVEFWVASQLMLAFKASYLLIYPYVMRLEEKDKHLGVVGLFSVLMHFGAIGGALLGGFSLEYLSPQDIFLFMPASDIVQVLICLTLLWKLKTPFRVTNDIENTQPQTSPLSRGEAHSRVIKLGLITLIFYFSAFLIRPFFSSFWEYVSQTDSEMFSAIVYSIPAWIALACLWWDHRDRASLSHFSAITRGALIAVVSLILQGSEQVWLVVIGRCLFGYALYQVTVRLEVLLFEISEPEHYAADFSKVHFFQNLGVIGASFMAGYLVENQGLQSTFIASLLGYTIAGLCFYSLFKTLRSAKETTPSPVIEPDTNDALVKS